MHTGENGWNRGIRSYDFSLPLPILLSSSIKSVMSNHVTISSAKPCKQSEIIITFAILRLLSCRDPLMLIWQQH